MGKKDLSYWDEEMDCDRPVSHDGKTKDRSHKNRAYDRGYDCCLSTFDDDDDEAEPLPLSQEYLNHMANILEQFSKLVQTYFIYPDLSREEYAAARKRIKKAVARMRKGDTRDFDFERTMEAVANGDIPEKYIDGGY